MMDENKYILCDKNNCCGCGACVEVCHQNAIKLLEDKYGFVYPSIDETKCIKCGMCKIMCSYQNDISKKNPIKTFVAKTNEEYIINSASGGIFSNIASNFILDGGIVYGCSMEFENSISKVKHIRIEDINKICELQGSKYVQSSMDGIYKRIKEDLINEKKVLFSGTPCQVAAVINYTKNIKKGKLYTIDLICHGVPNQKMFNDYILVLKNKKKYNEINNFKFRDKTYKEGMNASVSYKNKFNENKISIINSHFSSYYQLFLKSEIYRENCYSCKYAGKERMGDLTLGDFWGLFDVHSELKNNKKFGNDKGISCIICNSSNGFELINRYISNCELYDSTIDKVAKHNKQLERASIKGKDREKILSMYLKSGYTSVEKWYNIKYCFKNTIYYIFKIIPNRWKNKK